MPQLVGQNCSLCGESLSNVEAGRFCPGCDRPVHYTCQGPTHKEGSCRTCGAAAPDVGDRGTVARRPHAGSAAGFFDHWFSFQGRLSRGQYITHSVLSGVLTVTMILAISYAAENLGPFGPLFALMALFGVVVAGMWTETAVAVKRLHDVNRPGWHWLFCLVPILNLYMALVLLLQPGTVGENAYGSDPLGGEESVGDRLLLAASRHEMNGDWELAFDCYKQASEELKGQPNEEYAVECIKRLYEKVQLDQS